MAVEAQLCETPVVALRLGRAPDRCSTTEPAYLVPAGDIAALAQPLDALLSRPGRAAVLGRDGRMAALAGFAPESAARRYAGIYRPVVGNPER